MSQKKLLRQMGLMLVTATGICSMMGASINVIPFMIQKNVPGIGPYVVPAFLFAAIPAIFAAYSYAILSSSMPRAGGSYLYASRGLSPYLGFIASFSQWFGLSIVIGVIAYIIVPFIRDVFYNLGLISISDFLEVGYVRLSISLILIWIFVYVNIIGGKLYRNTLIPMLFIMFALGSIVIVSGVLFNQNDFIEAVFEIEKREITSIQHVTPGPWPHPGGPSRRQCLGHGGSRPGCGGGHHRRSRQRTPEHLPGPTRTGGR